MSEQTPKYQAGTQQTQQSQLALIKKDVVDVVAGAIRKYQESGQLQLPPDYSAENALKSAWLVLQNTKTKDDKPVLTACDKNSIANALLNMIIQGLTPAKNQCYFVAYGNQLTCMRSYFGTMTLAKRVDDNIEDIFAEVVYEGDTFKYRINRGKKEIIEHVQALENVDNKKIKAAYCTVYYRDGREKTEIMTIEEIKQAWKQSQVKPIDEKGNIRAGTTHEKFTAEMCKRTVINRCCKPIINSSSDSYLFRQAVRRSEEIAAEVTLEEEVAANANREVIDVEPIPGNGQAQDEQVTQEQSAQEEQAPPPKQAPPKQEKKQAPPEQKVRPAPVQEPQGQNLFGSTPPF